MLILGNSYLERASGTSRKMSQMHLRSTDMTSWRATSEAGYERRLLRLFMFFYHEYTTFEAKI
jgi:hypothetical protein